MDRGALLLRVREAPMSAVGKNIRRQTLRNGIREREFDVMLSVEPKGRAFLWKPRVMAKTFWEMPRGRFRKRQKEEHETCAACVSTAAFMVNKKMVCE